MDEDVQPDDAPAVVASVVSATAPLTRNEHLVDALMSAGICEVRVDGEDLRDATSAGLADRVDQPTARRLYGRGLTPAEVGCAASHRLAWQFVVDSGAAWGVVVEDDVVVVDERLRDAVRAVAGLDADQPWLVALHASRVVNHPLVVGPAVAPGVHRLAVTWHGACGYMVSGAAARLLLTGPDRVRMVADWPPEAGRCRLAVALPLPLRTGDFPSLIAEQRTAAGTQLRGSSLRDRYSRYVDSYRAVRPRAGYRAHLRWWVGAGSGINRLADRLAERGLLGWRHETIDGIEVVRRDRGQESRQPG